MVYLLDLQLFLGFVCAVLAHEEAGNLLWWQTTIVYQIYPRSFQDSDGDGVGDLQGIISRLDYIKSLDVDTIWLSPIYTSPMADFGYDVADYEDVDPVFGSLADFDHLVEEVHARRMKIIMDFVPNHTSDEHPWFRASKTGSGPFQDFYMWHDGQILEDGSRKPPNNWISNFGGSAWTWVEERQQYYLHQFTPEQPDLNYRNHEVVSAMKNVLRFWLERGVDGFRVDAILTLFEVPDLTLDEPRTEIEGITPHEYAYLDHIHTLHQPEIHEVVRGWNDVIDNYSEAAGKEIFTVMEIYDPTLHHAMEYYFSGSDMPFNFGLMFVNDTCGGTCFKDIINSWMELMPKEKWPNFVIGNHDQRRISSKKGPEYIDALNILLLTLPGTPTTYYGEEIGMLDIPMPTYKDTQDPWGIRLGEELYDKYTRDPCRSPMQWDDTQNAGFSTATQTWLPVHENYQRVNVQAEEGDPKSSLEIYRDVAHLRQQKIFQNNKLTFHVVNDNILSYIRWGGGEYAYLVMLNLGTKRSNNDYSWPLGDDRVKVGTVLVTTGNFKDTDNIKPVNIIPLSNIALDPGQGAVLQIKLLDKTLINNRHTDEL